MTGRTGGRGKARRGGQTAAKGPRRPAGETAAPPPAKPAVSGIAKLRPQAAGSASPLVLIVDDFLDNREMYAQFLVFSGYRVAEAADGEDAVEKTKALLPDVVVMDLSLPGMDGWEATRRLKREPETSHIPVIALTGHALAGHAEGAREAGCDSFVTKPCMPADLAAEIQRILRPHKPAPRKGGD